jgi:2-phosphosulfolactate phosphatase
MVFNQNESAVRFEWGLSGLKALAPVSDVIIIVDVLSFTTSVDIAVGNGAYIFPYAGSPEALPAYAQSVGAIIAGHRRQREARYSLAPSSLVSIPMGTRLVLPSPNGATLSLATSGVPTLAGCLRNGMAVAARASQLGKRISVIAAGERWPDGSLRPSLEDLLGAGSIIERLSGQRSPEAEMALAGFQHARPALLDTLIRCGSGKELIDQGFIEDVRLASELHISRTAPILSDGAYTHLEA